MITLRVSAGNLILINCFNWLSRQIEKFECELDRVYDMLNRLTSKDNDVSETAKDEIDVYLAQRQKRQVKKSSYYVPVWKKLDNFTNIWNLSTHRPHNFGNCW